MGSSFFDRLPGLIGLLFNDPLTFVLVAVPLLYSIIIHELAHGWVAYRMGDPTAKWMGRLTLNPLKHLDPMGTLALLVIGFGWAKPVPVNFSQLHPLRKGIVFVSAAGITANIILAFLSLFLLRLFQMEPWGIPFRVLGIFAQINIMLAAFNLIPIPPLDGSKILLGFASRRLQYTMMKIEPYGLLILVALLFLGVLNPVIRVFRWAIVSLISLILP